jgi:hypothetical protein
MVLPPWGVAEQTTQGARSRFPLLLICAGWLGSADFSDFSDLF